MVSEAAVARKAGGHGGGRPGGSCLHPPYPHAPISFLVLAALFSGTRCARFATATDAACGASADMDTDGAAGHGKGHEGGWWMRCPGSLRPCTLISPWLKAFAVARRSTVKNDRVLWPMYLRYLERQHIRAPTHSGPSGERALRRVPCRWALGRARIPPLLSLKRPSSSPSFLAPYPPSHHAAPHLDA